MGRYSSTQRFMNSIRTFSIAILIACCLIIAAPGQTFAVETDDAATLLNENTVALAESTVEQLATEESIEAHDFKWGASSGPLTAEKIIFLAGVKATSATGIPMDTSSISVDTAMIDKINAKISIGDAWFDEPMTFTTDGSTGSAASITVTVDFLRNGSASWSIGNPYLATYNVKYQLPHGHLSADEIIEKAGTYVVEADGNAGSRQNVQANAAQLQAINDVIYHGDARATPLPLTLTYTSTQTGAIAETNLIVTFEGRQSLTLRSESDKSKPSAGEIVTFNFTITNSGSLPIDGIWAKSTLSTQTVFVSCDPTGIPGAKADGTQYVNWFIPRLEIGETATLTVASQIKDVPAGTAIQIDFFAAFDKLGLPSNPDDDPRGDGLKTLFWTGASNQAGAVDANTLSSEAERTAGKAQRVTKLANTSDGTSVSGIAPLTGCVSLSALAFLITLLGFSRLKKRSL